jgi:hypothetical protein
MKLIYLFSKKQNRYTYLGSNQREKKTPPLQATDLNIHDSTLIGPPWEYTDTCALTEYPLGYKQQLM